MTSRWRTDSDLLKMEPFVSPSGFRRFLMPLTSDTLKGMWAGMPVPWTAQDQVERGGVAGECAADVPGRRPRGVHPWDHRGVLCPDAGGVAAGGAGHGGGVPAVRNPHPGRMHRPLDGRSRSPGSVRSGDRSRRGTDSLPFLAGCVRRRGRPISQGGHRARRRGCR